MTYELALMEREELGEKRGEKRGEEKAVLNNLRSVMKKLNLSVEKALEFLDVPHNERSYYLSKLNS